MTNASSVGFSEAQLGVTQKTGADGKVSYEAGNDSISETGSRERLAAADTMIKSSNESKVSEYRQSIASKVKELNEEYGEGSEEAKNATEKFDYISAEKFYEEAQYDEVEKKFFYQATPDGKKYYSYEDYLADIAGQENGLHNLNVL
jgi:hypothetical protein